MVEKCWRRVFYRSVVKVLEKRVVERCWRRVLEETRCREVLEKRAVEMCGREVREKSVVEKCWRRVFYRSVVKVLEKSVGNAGVKRCLV